MLSRLRYILRETADSFRRNVTLTVASIITAAISLLGVGLTLLSQHAFDNLLARWEGGVEMIVFMNPTATPDQLDARQRRPDRAGPVHRVVHVLRRAVLARRKPTGSSPANPACRDLLTEDTILTQFKVGAHRGHRRGAAAQVSDAFAELPGVYDVELRRGPDRA